MTSHALRLCTEGMGVCESFKAANIGQHTLFPHTQLNYTCNLCTGPTHEMSSIIINFFC